MTKLHSSQIFNEYLKQVEELVGTYCSLKQTRPLEQLPELSRAIWRAQTLTVLWASIAKIDLRSVK